jgi:Zn-dependent protease with chaperone function
VREAAGLLVFAMAVATIGVAGLHRARWPEHAPRLGVIAWQTLSGSVLAALLLAGVTLSVPSTEVGGSLTDLLHACVTALRAQYATPGGAALHAVGAAGTAALVVRSTFLVVTGLVGARRAREDHLHRLRLAARREDTLDALIVEHPAAAAYCLPGRARTIVLTSAAIAALGDAELAAVLTHERAHLRGRHHLVLAAASALARTLPFLPGLRTAQTEQARLVEMIADDEAAKGGARVTVARALVHLAEGSVPASALGAADVATAARVHRMLGPKHSVGVGRRTLIAAAIVLTATAPIVLAAWPAVAVAQSDSCPIVIASAPA